MLFGGFEIVGWIVNRGPDYGFPCRCLGCGEVCFWGEHGGEGSVDLALFAATELVLCRWSLDVSGKLKKRAGTYSAFCGDLS
jgi:hypothetical protein